MAIPTETSKAGDRRPAILGGVLRSHGVTLRRQAVRHSTLAADAEDALQDACLSFLRAYEGGPGEHAVRWLMLTVKRAAWQRSRRSRHEAAGLLSATDESSPGEPRISPACARPGPAEQAACGEDIAALDGLKPDHRTALLLLAFGYSYREIAARRGWTETKVNRCLAEGRLALREAR